MTVFGHHIYTEEDLHRSNKLHINHYMAGIPVIRDLSYLGQGMLLSIDPRIHFSSRSVSYVGYTALKESSLGNEGARLSQHAFSGNPTEACFYNGITLCL